MMRKTKLLSILQIEDRPSEFSRKGNVEPPFSRMFVINFLHMTNVEVRNPVKQNREFNYSNADLRTIQRRQTGITRGMQERLRLQAL